MNSVTPINLQKVSNLKNNQSQSLSKSNAAGQSRYDSYVPSFRGYQKTLGNDKKRIIAFFALCTTFIAGLFANKNKEKSYETSFKEQLAEKVSSDEIRARLLAKSGEAIEGHNGNLIEEIKRYEKSIESAQNAFERKDIKQAIIDTAAEIYGEVYENANRPSYHRKHFASAQSIKEALLEKRGVNIEVEYDDYYGRTITRIFYTYKDKEFNIPKESKYDETLNTLVNASFSGKLSSEKSIFE